MNIPETMNAALFTRYGAPDVLSIGSVTTPQPNKNEILINVMATTVTAGDARMRGFDVPLSFWIPARLMLGVSGPKKPILGMEMAGVVVAVGHRVTRFKVGDRVFGSTMDSGFGGYAPYKCMPEDDVIAHIPNGVSFEDAATLPIGGRTSLYFLRAANLKPGQHLLVNGASGSLGTFAIQLAKLMGAEVTALCSGRNADMVRGLGADHVIDYTHEDYTQRSTRYDVIYDAVGKLNYGKAINALTDDGAFLHASAVPAVQLRMLWTSMTSRKQLVGSGPPPESDDLIFLAELIRDGKLKPVVDKCYALHEIVEAHRHVDTGRKRGNVVVMIG